MKMGDLTYFCFYRWSNTRKKMNSNTHLNKKVTSKGINPKTHANDLSWDSSSFKYDFHRGTDWMYNLSLNNIKCRARPSQIFVGRGLF
eukprot:Gb_12296 [translate_table: standard]